MRKRALVAASALIACSAPAPTPASGSDSVPGSIVIDTCTITTPTRWAAGAYTANCNIELQSTLTIDPGATIAFGPGFSLNVGEAGVLTAVGTESSPIVFTSRKAGAAAGDWGCAGACGGVNLRGNGSTLEYVRVLYASSGVYVQGESVTIKSSTFAHNAGSGLVVDESFGGAMVSLNANTFFANGDYPLVLGRAVFIDGGSVFHDPENPQVTNGKQCVSLDTNIDQLTVLGVTELGFLFGGHAISAEILLPPGTIFKSTSAAIELEKTGSLVNGPNATFTSAKDDALGGDCTGDGPSAPASGDWEGLLIEDAAGTDYAAPADYIRYAARSGTTHPH